MRFWIYPLIAVLLKLSFLSYFLFPLPVLPVSFLFSVFSFPNIIFELLPLSRGRGNTPPHSA